MVGLIGLILRIVGARDVASDLAAINLCHLAATFSYYDPEVENTGQSGEHIGELAGGTVLFALSVDIGVTSLNRRKRGHRIARAIRQHRRQSKGVDLRRRPHIWQHEAKIVYLVDFQRGKSYLD